MKFPFLRSPYRYRAILARTDQMKTKELERHDCTFFFVLFFRVVKKRIINNLICIKNLNDDVWHQSLFVSPNQKLFFLFLSFEKISQTNKTKQKHILDRFIGRAGRKILAIRCTATNRTEMSRQCKRRS